MDEQSAHNVERVPRLNPRFAAELFLDCLELYEQPKALADYLKEQGFYPDLLRAKGYINRPLVVGILPFMASDLSRVAALSVNKNIQTFKDEEIPAGASIVTMADAVTPASFQLLTLRRREVSVTREYSFDELRQEGTRAIVSSIMDYEPDFPLERLSRGRGIAAIALQDFAADERKLGFITESEYTQTLVHSDMYADIARMHAYLTQAAAPEDGGCSYCCSTSCYACTSSSCDLIG